MPATYAEWNALFSQPEEEKNASIKIDIINGIAGIVQNHVIDGISDLNKLDLQLPEPKIFSVNNPFEPIYSQLDEFRGRRLFEPNNLQNFTPNSLEAHILNIQQRLGGPNSGFFTLVEEIFGDYTIHITIVNDISMYYSDFDAPYKDIPKLASLGTVEEAIRAKQLPDGNLGISPSITFQHKPKNKESQLILRNLSFRFNWIFSPQAINDPVVWQLLNNPNNEQARRNDQANDQRGQWISAMKRKIAGEFQNPVFAKENNNRTALKKIGAVASFGINGEEKCNPQHILVKRAVLEKKMQIFCNFGGNARYAFNKYSATLAYHPRVNQPGQGGGFGGGGIPQPRPPQFDTNLFWPFRQL